MTSTAPRRTEITRADILPMEQYGRERRALRQAIIAAKKPRRVEVGPIATFYFENYQTMWFQVHEMLFVEKGGEAQIDDELRAYNPLIPNGKELVATVMLEIEDPARRAAMLLRLSNVENHMFMSVGGDMIRGRAEAEVDRTRASDGKTSSVHFVHFPFTDDQILRFRTPGVQVVLGFDHPEYAHMAVLPPAERAALGEDFVL